MIRIGPRVAAGALRIGGSVLQGLADGIELVVGSDPPADARVRVTADGDVADGEADRPAEAARADEASPARAASNGHGTNRWSATAVPPPEPPVRPEAPAAAPSPEEPAHVSEEPVLVEEVADEGAAEGAGPEIHVAEPWEGYAAMRAPEIADRLAAEDAAVIAVVQLYEAQNRNRRSVLAAAERGLRRPREPQ